MEERVIYSDAEIQELIKYISQFAVPTPEDLRQILDQMDARKFKKGDILLKENQPVQYSYFVLKGCVRQYYVIDGEEKTTEFYTEGQPITLYDKLAKRKPSKFYLACLEDSIITLGAEEETPSDLAIRFEHVCRKATEEELAQYQERLSMYIINGPEERYLNLLKTRPNLIDRVPQYQLASYLGITPESLSRIRKRIMLKA